MRLVGLTGGIASGKSTVAEHLRTLGVHVIDADQVARDVVAPGTEGLQAVLERFGAHLSHADGSLNRKALGAIVVSDSQARKDLEQITHPLIQADIAQRIQQRLSAGDEAVVVEAALLVETGSYHLYDDLWVVRSSTDNQIQRLMGREGCSRQMAESWLSAQLPMADKVRHATTVIDNDGDLATLQLNVEAAWHEAIVQPQDLG